MLDKIRRLQPAAQVARSREDVAARELADLQRRLLEQQARLQQLLGLRAEYAEQFQATGEAGFSARRFQDYAAFLSNLDRNIGHLQQHVQRLQGELEGKRHAWMMRHARTQALEGVIQRCDLEQRQRENRCEQLEADEHALRRPDMNGNPST